MLRSLLFSCIVSGLLLASCKKDKAQPEISKTEASPATASEPGADTILFNRYSGIYKSVDNCPMSSGLTGTQIITTTSTSSFFARINNDSSLQVYGIPTYAALYDSVQHSSGTIRTYWKRSETNHYYRYVKFDGDSVHAFLSVFHCTIGSNCEVWSDQYYFDGEKSE